MPMSDLRPKARKKNVVYYQGRFAEYPKRARVSARKAKKGAGRIRRRLGKQVVDEQLDET